MCYFLLVGTSEDMSIGNSWQALEDGLALPLDRIVPQASARVAFPADDVVWLLTHRGCSCDLLLSARTADATVQLNKATRQAMHALAQRTGTLRFYVRYRRGPGAVRSPRLTMTSEELMDPKARIPANCLIDLVSSIPSSH